MKKILITGSEGFIGSHLVELAVKREYEVVALIQYNSFGNKGWLDQIDERNRAKINCVWGDLRDRGSLLSAMQGCDAVLNLAALIAIPYSYRAPESYVDTNISGTLNILEAARALRVKKIVQISTSEVYGTAQYVPIDEAHPLNAQSPYAATKIASDQLALSYFCSFDLPVAIARPFNTYGPRQSNRAVIPTMISQVTSGKDKIKLGSLSPTRDFSYVTDIADGILAIMESPNSTGTVINLGSNFEISIKDVVNIISEVTGKTIVIEQEDERIRPQKSEVERLFANTSKAQKLLGWNPKFSGKEGFMKGIELTLQWFSNPANLARYETFTYGI